MNSFSHFRPITVNRELRCKRKAPITVGGLFHTDQTPNSSAVTYPKPKHLDVGSFTLSMHTSAWLIYGIISTSPSMPQMFIS